VGRLVGCAGGSAVLFAGALLFATACGREEADQTVNALPVEFPAVSDRLLPERWGEKQQAERWDEKPQFESAGEGKLARKFLASLRKRDAERSPEERQHLREERAARAEAMEDELVEQLGDPDPSVRAEAASELPIGGKGEEEAERLQRLARVAADDPDPRARIAAVGRLGEADSPDAVNPLVEALYDPDREVVLEALDALQDRDDATVIPYLDPLLEDPDPEIREEAEYTREWLQW
jgi:hypothetical protein